jgi:hypothetical protein
LGIGLDVGVCFPALAFAAATAAAAACSELRYAATPGALAAAPPVTDIAAGRATGSALLALALAAVVLL